MSTADPSTITSLPLSTNLARGTVVVSLVFGILSIITVSCRLAVRIRGRMYGWDDILLVVGLLFYIPDITFGVLATYHGVGHMNAELVSPYLQIHSMKYYYLWIIFYVIALLFVKTSICLTILRITGTNRKYRLSVWVLIACSIISFLIVFCGLMFYCLPMEGVWDPSLVAAGKAKCATLDTLIVLSYASTVGTIITDLGCAVLPGVILYQTQMKVEQKLAVGALLSFASAASITTIIRTPYIDHYHHPLDDLMFWVAHIILFSNVEIGIGCIATSLPQLRVLWMRSRGENSQSRTAPRSHGSNNLVTFGSAPVTGRKKTRTTPETGQTLATVYAQGDGDWERLDNSSDKGLVDDTKGIRAEYSFAVEMSDAPKHTREGSAEH